MEANHNLSIKPTPTQVELKAGSLERTDNGLVGNEVLLGHNIRGNEMPSASLI